MKSTWFSMVATGACRLLRKCFGLALALAAFGGAAWGFNPTDAAPEIDPGSAFSSLALLAGGVLLLYDRYRRR
ncbi:MAG TPA: hypothetical protein VMF69_14820 [Gemmataceae bacterium]|nr:hypothetical protein [Gemmataceae bacterium]